MRRGSPFCFCTLCCWPSPLPRLTGHPCEALEGKAAMRRHVRYRRRRHGWIGWLLLAAGVVAGGLGILPSPTVPPRSLGPYIEQRLSAHGPLLVASGRWLASLLVKLDRGDV